MSEKRLASVVLTWSDGSSQELHGEAAEAWLERCNNALALNQIRGGYTLPNDPWKHHVPKEKT